MQDPGRPRLEPGSTKPPVVDHEDYSHLTHGPQHGSRGSGDQMEAQSQQRPQQQVNQELPQQNVRPNQYRPKSDSVGESSSTISVSSDSHYSGSDVRPQITVTTTQQGANAQTKSKADTQRTTDTTSHDESKNHVDNAKQELVNDNDDYLIPTAEMGGKDSKLDVKTPGRNSKLPISSRTEPFSSEGEEEDEDEDEEEEEDEDSAALRSALQEQLDSGDTSNPVVRIEVTKHESPKEQGAPIQSENNNQNGTTAEKQGKKKDDTENEDEMEESESEIGSDMSLPLSDTQEGQAKPSGSTWTAGQDAMETTSSKNLDVVSSLSLTVKAFWLLVHTVEIEIDQSDDIGGIYNSPHCTEAIKNEIIKSANLNSGLSRLDPNAVSMVVIQTLPLIVATLPGGCLMSDKMLSSNRPINEISVRSFIYSAALGFWDQFLRHLTHLIKKGVLEADEIADKFAPQLISPESKMTDKAVKVLHQILEDVQGDDSYLDDSSMTQPTPTPQRQTDTREESNQQHLKVPPLNLGDTDRSDRTEDDSDEDTEGDDSFFDSKVPLTETDAYQRLLGNTYDKPKTETVQGGKDVVDDESSSEDEIEKAARITPETPSSANRKKRNVLSSLGGVLSHRSDDDDVEDKLKVTGGGSTQRSDAVSSPSQSDLLSSPSPPGTGYIPSAMEHSMKSTARSDPLQRSAAFWGEESDMDESEMSVPMGTGTLKSGEDKDDFDFYD